MFDFFTKDQWLAIPYGFSCNWVLFISAKLPKIFFLKMCRSPTLSKILMVELFRIPIMMIFGYVLIYSFVFGVWFLSIRLFQPLVDDWRLFIKTWAFSWSSLAFCVTLFLNWKYKR